MGTEKSGVTGAFYAQLLLIVGIFIAGAIGFKWCISEMRSVVSEEVKSLVTEIAELKKDLAAVKESIADNDELIADNTAAIRNTVVSINIFIDSYNRKYHTEFLRPVDITTESIVKENKRRKR